MKPRVLLADDSLTIQKVISLTLDGYDLALSFCKTEQELDEVLLENEFDILLLDYGISEETAGIDFVKEINQKYPRLKVLPLLGTLDSSSTEELKEIGIMEAIIKPFDGNSFISAFENILGETLNKIDAVPEEDSSLPESLINTKGDAMDVSWTQEVPGIIGGSESVAQEVPGVINHGFAPTEEVTTEEQEPTRFPEDNDLVYPTPETEEEPFSVKDEMTSKLVSLDDLNPLGDTEGLEGEEYPDIAEDDEVFEEGSRAKEIEDQIEEETMTDLWTPDKKELLAAIPNLSKSEVRLIAQEVVEDYMKESLKRALKDIVPEIAEKIISQEVNKISERILRDEF